eukprot:1772251-Prymnesium_polylepis.1
MEVVGGDTAERVESAEMAAAMVVVERVAADWVEEARVAVARVAVKPEVEVLAAEMEVVVLAVVVKVVEKRGTGAEVEEMPAEATMEDDTVAVALVEERRV